VTDEFTNIIRRHWGLSDGDQFANVVEPAPIDFEDLMGKVMSTDALKALNRTCVRLESLDATMPTGRAMDDLRTFVADLLAVCGKAMR